MEARDEVGTSLCRPFCFGLKARDVLLEQPGFPNLPAAQTAARRS
ncbi:hypothetical protein [Streptomyces cyslabdanicus]